MNNYYKLFQDNLKIDLDQNLWSDNLSVECTENSIQNELHEFMDEIILDSKMNILNSICQNTNILENKLNKLLKNKISKSEQLGQSKIGPNKRNMVKSHVNLINKILKNLITEIYNDILDYRNYHSSTSNEILELTINMINIISILKENRYNFVKKKSIYLINGLNNNKHNFINKDVINIINKYY